VNASWPLLRSVVFGGVAVVVSLVGHVAAGGAIPDAAGLLLALAFTVSGYRVLLARREQSWIILTGALGLVELVLHEVFMAWAAGPPMSSGMRGPGMGAALGGDGAGHSEALWPNPTMVLAHLLAAVMLAWVLRQGEAALWSAARRGVARLWRPVVGVVARVVAALVAVTPVRTQRPRSHAQIVPELGRWRPRWATAGRARRGPPQCWLSGT
jgi:hypothetical protein